MMRTRSPRKVDDIPIAPSLYSLSNKMGNSLLAVRDINHIYIVIEWNLPGNCKLVTVTITDSEGYVQTVDVMPPERSYAFTEGLHGTLYTVSVEGTLKDDSREEIYEKDVLYLDYDKLPDMPLPVIQTSDGKEP